MRKRNGGAVPLFTDEFLRLLLAGEFAHIKTGQLKGISEY